MSALFLSMFALGLATSLHCIGMCGPMVVTYAVKGEEDGPWHKKLIPNLAYQGAKITSYVIVGLALGAIGSAFNLNGIRPWIMFAAGVFMIILGLGMTGKVPWAARLTPRPPKFLITALSKLRRKAKTDAEPGREHARDASGVRAAHRPHAVRAAPGRRDRRGRDRQCAAWRDRDARVRSRHDAAHARCSAPHRASSPRTGSTVSSIMLAVVVMVFGLVFINRAAMLVGSPVTFNSVKSAVARRKPEAATAPATAYKTGADGVVEVPFAIINTRYVPESVSIPADKPVRLLLDRQEDVACSDRLVIKQLGRRRRAGTQCGHDHRPAGDRRGYVLDDVRHGHDVRAARRRRRCASARRVVRIAAAVASRRYRRRVVARSTSHGASRRRSRTAKAAAQEEAQVLITKPPRILGDWRANDVTDVPTQRSKTQ